MELKLDQSEHDQLMELGALPTPAITQLWKYMQSKSAAISWPVRVMDDLKRHNETLKNDVPSLSDLSNQSSLVRKIQRALNEGSMDSEMFTKWLEFASKAEAGRLAKHSYRLFDNMLENVDILMNDVWFKAVLEARKNTLIDFRDDPWDYRESILNEQRNDAAHYRLLQLLTLEEYEEAYNFCQKISKNGKIDSVVDLKLGLYTKPLDLNELYPLIENVYKEKIYAAAKSSFETIQRRGHE